MTVSLGKRLFDLPPNVSRRAALSLETAQPVPQTDDFLLFFGIHGGCSGVSPNVNEKRTNFKPQADYNAVPPRRMPKGVPSPRLT
jgi:hypothetical protein